MTDEAFAKLPKKVQDFWGDKLKKEFTDNHFYIKDIESTIETTCCRIFYSVKDADEGNIVGYGVIIAFFDEGEDIKISDDSLAIEALKYLFNYYMCTEGK